MNHNVSTSRGNITILDTHIFEIVIPADTKDIPRLVITIGDKSFRIGALLDASREVSWDGKRVDNRPS